MLSVVINTKNAARTLPQALKSVAFADEVVVVDMNSQDRTVEIAQKAGARVFSHPDVGYVEPARNFAVGKAKGDWVFILDADEEIPKSLQAKIATLITGDATANAYYVPRKNIIFNHWFQRGGWWPDYVLRLFRQGSVVWSDRIHQQPVVRGEIDKLAAVEDFAIIHHNYQTVEQFIERLNRYTSHEVSSRGRKPITSATLVGHLENELMRRLFQEHGIDSGIHGVSISLLQSFYELIVALKHWQELSFAETHNDQLETIKGLRHLQQSLNYWIADWHVTHSSGLAKIIWKVRRKFRV